MEITDVRVRMVDDEDNRLKAVCTVTFDDEFVVRDVKVVEGTHGPFVAMPSRKLSASCPKCGQPNHLRAKFCNECGRRLPPMRIPADENGKAKAHRDVAHPVTPAFRQLIQSSVLEAYQAEFGHDEEGDYEQVEHESDQRDEREMTEYDTLISDLRGGGRRERPVPPRPPAGADRDEPRRRKRGRRGRRDREEQRQPQRAQRERRPVVVHDDEDEDAEAAEPEKVFNREEEERAPATQVTEGFGVSLDAAEDDYERRPQSREHRWEEKRDQRKESRREDRPPAEDRPRAKEPRPQPEKREAPQQQVADQPPAADDDDDAPFGAGIL